MMTMDKTLDKIRHEVGKAFKQELISLMVYGSAAVNDHQQGSSDINILVVVNDITMDVLDRLRKLIRPLAKAGVNTPLLMTKEHIERSSDVFPIEFLEIKEKHLVLQGEDMFAHLEIETTNLRHECEHELKGRLLRLRQSYLEVGEHVKELKDLLVAAHQANLPSFRTALRLKGIVPPLAKEAVLESLAATFGLNKEVFVKLKLLKQGDLKLTFPMLRGLLETYLHEVEKVARAIDRL